MSKSGQKFVARNRAPRVQIEYDVEVYGAEKSVQLPFIMGVMSDLSGASAEPLPAVGDRKFLEIDVDNFDERMKSIRPRAAFHVPNTLTGDGNLSVDLTFERMEDFSPAAIARKVEPLRKLLEARTQLSHLVTYMDGKTGAEDLIAKLISDPATLAALTGVSSATSPPDDQARALESLRTAVPTVTSLPQADDVAAILGSLRATPVVQLPDDATSADAVLDQMRLAAAAVEQAPPEAGQAFIATDETDFAPEALDGSDALSTGETGDADDEGDDLASLLSEDGNDDEALDLNLSDDTDDGESDLADVTGGDTDTDDDLDALLAGLGSDTSEDMDSDDEDEDEDEDEDDDLTLLLSEDNNDDEALDLDLSVDSDDGESDLADVTGDEPDTDDDLDALLAGLGSDTNSDEASDDEAFDLDSLLLEDDAPAETESTSDPDETPAVIANPFGILSAERPEELNQPRSRFRIALLGDFSGRAARGLVEIGDDLAARKPIRFDVDSIDAVIARFATTLVLPIGNDGAGVEVKLRGLDDLHPDALYDNVALFDELSTLRQRVARGDAKAMAELQTWAGNHGDFNPSSRKRAKGSAVPADRKLSDFQSLIGDMQGSLTQASPASELIARIVGPYVHAARDPAQDKMLGAVDEALSGAMRAILHHPDFQAVEAIWRSLELLARRIETGAGLDVVLYDVSAEEWAADLSAQEDLSESGLFRMLAEEPRLDAAQGPLSAVFGLYTLEETPPHAELLARMSKISAWMNAPFVSAISPQFLETRKHDRHPIVAKTWDDLRALPEAAYVGLVAPRFLLRLPYGRKTEPVDPFDFEEFTLRSGLRGMLWANPVVLSAILMAATVTKMGKTMRLGEIMSLGDIPLHIMTDQHGDQIALPCTERLLDTRSMAEVVTRGFMPVLSIKGRNEVRQGSFQSLGGSMLAGTWAQPAMKATAGSGTESGTALPTEQDDAAADESKDDSLGDFNIASSDESASDTDDDGSLDDLLASFQDDAGDAEESELDPELAALLEGL